MGINQLKIRPCELRDERLLLQWRNDPEAIRWSQSGRAVGSEEHSAWFRSSLSSSSVQIFIGFYPDLDPERVGEDCLGMVRFDHAPEASSVSIYIKPAARSQGVAKELLSSGIRLLAAKPEETLVLLAFVHDGNSASQQLFSSAGFEFDGRVGEFARLKKRVQAISNA